MKKLVQQLVLCLALVGAGVAQQTAQQALSITVASQLQITTTSLPGAIVNVIYPPQQLQASGGVPPYTWSLATGSSLPAGLTLSAAGVVSGTPTAAGSFSFTVQVKDSGTALSVKKKIGATKK